MENNKKLFHSIYNEKLESKVYFRSLFEIGKYKNVVYLKMNKTRK